MSSNENVDLGNSKIVTEELYTINVSKNAVESDSLNLENKLEGLSDGKIEKHMSLSRKQSHKSIGSEKQVSITPKALDEPMTLVTEKTTPFQTELDNLENSQLRKTSIDNKIIEHNASKPDHTLHIIVPSRKNSAINHKEPEVQCNKDVLLHPERTDTIEQKKIEEKVVGSRKNSHSTQLDVHPVKETNLKPKSKKEIGDLPVRKSERHKKRTEFGDPENNEDKLNKIRKSEQEKRNKNKEINKQKIKALNQLKQEEAIKKKEEKKKNQIVVPKVKKSKKEIETTSEVINQEKPTESILEESSEKPLKKKKLPKDPKTKTEKQRPSKTKKKITKKSKSGTKGCKKQSGKSKISKKAIIKKPEPSN